MPQRQIIQTSMSQVNVQSTVDASVALKDKSLIWSIWRQIIFNTAGDTLKHYNSPLLNRGTLHGSHALVSFLRLFRKKN